ncbi:MAG TPA: sulfatase-like hydrolase/transferase [Solirubrobacteraceae bacterium]|nr:sulfatase-like hydrolase/transferase [Solirubrobacteraceae bacterium]
MGKSEDRTRRITRGELLKAAAVAAPGALLAGRLGAGAQPAQAGEPKPRRSSGAATPAGMNAILFLTDQERAVQHFPPGWSRRNLPGLTRLARHGVSFENAFTNACMCSPARTTLMTGFFPAQHGVRYTLEESMPASEYPQVECPLDFANPASVMAAAGYQTIYKGKWHLSKPEGAEWQPSDVGRYGFARWNPPDAGANQELSQAGGGVADNDGRIMDSTGSSAEGREGALEYLRSRAAQEQPFFLVVSLVNPHDVLFYPNTYGEGGYDASWLRGEIKAPATAGEDLASKPRVQEQFLRLFDAGSGRISTPAMRRAYLNFYGNLMKASDEYLVQVLDSLEGTGLLENTLIVRTSDHGEMGLAHGGLRQKNFNVYEESLRVPLVYSNPRLFPAPRRSGALVSHVDLLPTLAGLFDAPAAARAQWQGVDYSEKVLDPRARPPQDYTVFTYDDWQSGQPHGPYPTPPNHIVSIRERRWKIARYYDAEGRRPPQWELYDLQRDPLERRNLGNPGTRLTRYQQSELRRLRARLAEVESTRLQPLASS